jgi:hypothetical protein
MVLPFTNLAISSLDGAIDDVQTTIDVQAADAAKFPSPTGSEWAPIILGHGPTQEYLRCTGRSGATLTVARGQEGSAAQSWPDSTPVEHRLTAAALAGMQLAYEEGTWTPALNFGGAAVGITYATQVGRYTKVGRKVTVHGSIVLTSKGSSAGAATIAGLPFTSANDAIPAAASIGFASGHSMMSGAIIGTIAANASRITLYQSASGSSAAISNSNYSNSAQIVFSASYDV